MESTILQEAQSIVYGAESRERQYGSFSECMDKAAAIFNLIGPRACEPLCGADIYRVLIALKLARESQGHKRDNLVDLCGYAAGLDDYINSYAAGLDDYINS